MKNETTAKIITSFLVGVFFSFTLFFFGPTSLYFTNSGEFSFSFAQIWQYPFVLSAISTLFISLILLFIKATPYQKILSLSLMCSFLFWLQGNILVWNYGVLDGKTIDWSSMALYGLIDGVVWLGLLVVAFIKADFFTKIARSVCFAFILIQLVSFIVYSKQTPSIMSYQKYSLDTSTKFTFSARQNVIILLLDTFQSDVFQEILNEDPDYHHIFDGFTYFRNSLAGFSKTYASVPVILTGNYYDNTIPIQDFMRIAYTSNSSLPYILRKKGYEVDLFPHPINTIYCNGNIASNLKAPEMDEARYDDLDQLYNAALFRYSPQIIKRQIYNKNLFSGFFQNFYPEALVYKSLKPEEYLDDISLFSAKALKIYDVEFICQMLSEAKIYHHNQPTFKFYHLDGIHAPLILDERLKYERMAISRANFIRQAKADLKIITLFLEALKKLKIYDNSLLVILGDHGAGEYRYGGVNIISAGLKEAKRTDFISERIKAGGVPLLLMKPLGSKGKLKISDAPVSLADIPKTVFTELGIKNEAPGRSIYSVKDSDQRLRIFYLYAFNGWNAQYLSKLNEYMVDGHAWLSNSWKKTGRVFESKKM